MAFLNLEKKTQIQKAFMSAMAFAGMSEAALDFNILDILENETQGPLNLFVDSSLGKDTNPGTSIAPFKTIQAAIDSLPKRIRHPVVINVAAGNHVGFKLEHFDVEMGAAGVGAWLRVVGTMSAATLTSGLASGAVASATAGIATIGSWGTVTVTGAGWTVSDLRCKHLRIVSGTGAGQIKAIYDNTATVITVQGTWATAPNATSTFEIVEPGSIINSGVEYPLEPTGPGLNAVATANSASVFVNGCRFGAATASTTRSRGTVENFKLTGSGDGVTVLSTDKFSAFACNLNGNTNGMRAAGRHTRAQAVECVSTKAGMTFVACGSSADGGAEVSASSCVASGIAVASSSILKNDCFQLNVCAFVGVTNSLASVLDASNGTIGNVLSTGSGSAQAIRRSTSTIAWHGSIRLFSSQLDSFATVFDGNGPGFIRCSALTGTGNTTVFSLVKGARIQVDSGSTITGTNEIVIDGAAAVTIASMRAASPKVLPATASPYGTCIYE